MVVRGIKFEVLFFLLIGVGVIFLFGLSNSASTSATELPPNEIDTDETIIPIYLNETILTVPEGTKSFFLEGEIPPHDSMVRIVFENGEEELLEVHRAHRGRDTDVVTESTLSTPFSLSEEVVSITYFSDTDEVPLVKQIKDAQQPVLSPVTASRFSTASITARRSFFGNLGLPVQLREDWGAPGTSTWLPYFAPEITQIVVHHTATNINEEDPAQAVRDIYNYHYYRCANNIGSYDPDNPNCDETHELWQDIGYNYLIDQNGTIYEGRAGGNGVTAAHSPPNSGTIGIGFIGTSSNQIPSGPARDSFQRLVARLSAFNEIEPVWGSTIVGHRDRQVTACPGEDFYGALGGIVNEIPPLVDLLEELNLIASDAQKLTENREEEFVQVDASLIQMVVRRSSISNSTYSWLQNDAPTATDFKTYGDFVIFDLDRAYAKKVIKEVRAQSPNAVVQPNFKKEIAAWTGSVPDDYDETVQWHAEKINMENVWAEANCPGGSRCGGNNSVTVAVIDTGAAYEDFDFDAGANYTLQKFSTDPNYFNIEVPDVGDSPDGEFNEGYDRQYRIAPELSNATFVSPYDYAWDFLCFLRDGTGNPCNAIELDKRNHANDDDGHGTFVSTIIAGNTGDLSSNNIVGLAHNVQIMPIKAFFPNDSSMCYDENYDNDPTCASGNREYSLRGISFSFLLAQSINYAVNNGADVINMSLSGGGTDPLLQNAVENGVVVVAASGNNNADVANYFPGGLDNVISVGASTQTDGRASYSNFGAKLDLVAPVGESGIPSMWYGCAGLDTCWREDSGDLYTSFTSDLLPQSAAGTSFAAPQVSAAAALLKAKYPDITPQEIELTIKLNARDVGTSGKDNQTGYGVLDVFASLQNRINGAAELDNFRFYNVDTGAHFYTVSTVERNSVQANLPQYIYEGPNYRVWDTDAETYSPVFRFYNVDTGAHFYTSSTVERDSVQANLPQYIYEGITYYISSTQISGTVPLFRFYNVDTGAHFYTNSTLERDSVINNLPQYIYEGVAYYVLPK